MSTITENHGFDIGPLSWVKGEIDVALEEAFVALTQYLAEHESTRIKFARTHLQQAIGALAMVGVNGAVQVAEALDMLLGKVENREITDADGAIAIVEGGFSVLRQYLGDLLIGEPPQSLRLLPVYQEVTKALGKQKANPIDLFFPDLSRRPPKRKAETKKLSPAARKKLIHGERVLFQKGLLTWLRAKDAAQAKDGLNRMRAALNRIEVVQTSPSVRAFWWSALGLVTALLNGGTKVGDARSLCARIDQQIRRLQEGHPGIADRLLRDCLFYVANVPGEADPLLKDIQGVYQLKRLIPSKDQVLHEINAAQTNALHALKEIVAAVSEQWNRFCSGSAPALAAFAEQSKNIPQYVAVLGEELKPLTDALASTAAWLAADASRQTETLAMEVATALILIQNTLDNYLHLSENFPAQAALVVRRLASCRAGKALDDTDAPILDEMARRAQEKLLMTQVAREIQTSLGEVEQVLDAFFRDNSKRPQKAELERPLNQIAGALSILGQDEALDYLKACEGRVLAFAKPDYAPDHAACEGVAQEISTLGFFVDALAGGEISFGEFMRKFDVRSVATEEDEGTEETQEAGDSVETQLEELKKKTRSLLKALQADPGNMKLRSQLSACLEELQKDADLVADEALLAQAKSALKALKQTKESAPQAEMKAVAEALAPISVQPVIPAPSAKTMQLVEASAEELDAELLEIFLEEAQEVLMVIQENLDVLRRQPNEVENLTAVRRSFHTLKGSGRMVGLKDLGETAWEVEQTLNLWLRQEMLVTPELLEMVKEAHQVFLAWVSALAAHDYASVPAYADLMARAKSLRGNAGEETPPPPVVQKKEEPALEAMPDFTLSAPHLEESGIEMSGTQIFGDIEPLAEEPSFEATMLGGSISDIFDIGQPAEEVPALEVEANERAAPENPSVAPEPSAPLNALELDDKGEEQNVVIGDLSISPQLYEIFREESTGHLNTLKNFRLELEETPGMETPYEVGRAAHTLAGIAGTVGFMPLNELAHELEMTLLRRNESDQRDLLEGVEIIGQTIDTLAAMQTGLTEGKMPEPKNKLVKMLSLLYPSAPAGEEQHKAELQEAPAEPPLAPFGLDDSVESIELVEAMDSDMFAEEPNGIQVGEVSPEPESAFTGMELAEVGGDFSLDDFQPEFEQTIPQEAGDGFAMPTPELPQTQARVEEKHEFVMPTLKDEFDEQLIPIFLEEAEDLLAGFQKELSAWRANRKDEAAPRALARVLHTFKGSARMAGAMNLGELTHATETQVNELMGLGGGSDADLDEIASVLDTLADTVERYRAGDFSAITPPLPAISTKQPEAGQDAAAAGDSPAATPEGEPAEGAEEPEKPASHHAPDAESTRAQMRVRADLVDKLVNEAGELSIARARIEGEMRGLKGSLGDLTDNV
ncbi:MAG: Hpt domain-containing protein, partial [Zoogloeaceae bacterium]|nr:Hpt domain-containing protein [Zoogloeaceae bacterium]